MSDAQWLADLLAHGLVRGSFVPPAPIQALRELTRTRKQLGREVTAHSQRIEKVLESADVKLAMVLHPLLGVSGRAIVAALAAGETDPERLVALAHPRLRAKRDALRAALPGHVRPHHRVLLRQHLRVDASAGKHRSTRIRKGAPWLKPVLIQGAWAVVRGRDSYLRAQFLRLKSRRGPMTALVAVAASMLTAAYYMLRDDQDYHDLGAAHFQRVDHDRLVVGLTRRLHHLGYEVTLRPAA